MTVIEALHEKDKQRVRAEAEAAEKTKRLCERIPALAELDKRLASHGPALVAAAIGGNQKALAELEQENLRLQEERKALLQKHGLRPDEDAPVYACDRCHDTGYDGLRLCDCVRETLAVAAYTESGLGKGLAGKTFDSFSLSYYQGEDRTHMETVLSICKKYAQSFTPDAQSLLFMGKTGLGKTHLSAAIAYEAARKGCNVLYETAQKLFDTYEAARFGRDVEGKAARYETCGLLIIDDLGAECAGNYTSAMFFNLLNIRLINGKPMIISTNLNRPQLEKTYGERTLSRLLGEFRVLLFKGEDVRMQNLKR